MDGPEIHSVAGHIHKQFRGGDKLVPVKQLTIKGLPGIWMGIVHGWLLLQMNWKMHDNKDYGWRKAEE